MKKLFFLTLLLIKSILVFSQDRHNYLIGLGETQILISNNYILPQKTLSDKNVQFIKVPWKDQILNVYGKQLSITVSNSLIRNMAFSDIIADSAKLKQYNFENLEFQILKNDKVLYSWRNVESGSIIDDKTNRLQKSENIKAFKILDQTLSENDVVKISFRTKGGEPFLNCILNKIKDDQVPLVCLSIHNPNGVSLESFVEEALSHKKDINYSFY